MSTHSHRRPLARPRTLLEHFPEARGYATPEVVSRAAWEAEFNKTTKYWTSRFPGELPETPVVPEVLNSDEILVDGQVVNLIHVGQGDVKGSTIFHVPSADAVVAGDVVYNNVHMMMYEADEAKREAWIASIDVVAALNPKIVVAGHKSVGAADLPENLAASQLYLRDFTTLAKKRARWRTWSTASSSCMASATSRTRYGFRPEPKSLGGHELQRSGSFAVRTDHPTARPAGRSERESMRLAGIMRGQLASALVRLGGRRQSSPVRVRSLATSQV